MSSGGLSPPVLSCSTSMFSREHTLKYVFQCFVYITHTPVSVYPQVSLKDPSFFIFDAYTPLSTRPSRNLRFKHRDWCKLVFVHFITKGAPIIMSQFYVHYLQLYLQICNHGYALPHCFALCLQLWMSYFWKEDRKDDVCSCWMNDAFWMKIWSKWLWAWVILLITW